MGQQTREHLLPRRLESSHSHGISLSLFPVTLRRIAAAVIFNGNGSPLLSPRTPAYTNWRLGLAPDSTQTFATDLISMGVGVGFALSTFRFTLFREPEIRRLDLYLMLFQVRYAPAEGQLSHLAYACNRYAARLHPAVSERALVLATLLHGSSPIFGPARLRPRDCESNLWTFKRGADPRSSNCDPRRCSSPRA